MKNILNYIIAAVFAAQSLSYRAHAGEAGEEHVCNGCVADNAKAGDVVERNGVRWRLDHSQAVEGHTIWYAERAGPPQGRSMGEVGSGPTAGASMGKGAVSRGEGAGGGPGSGRITGRDFSDFEDSTESSKKDRAELAQYRTKIISRLNQEAVADAEATDRELGGELQSLNAAVEKSESMALNGPQLPAPYVDSVDAVATGLGGDPANPDASEAAAGWLPYDDHPFISDHQAALEGLRVRLNSAVPKSPQQADAKLTGYFVLDQTDGAYANNDLQMGDQLLAIAGVLTDIATDIIPITSIPKDFYRVVVGRDPATGEPIPNWERYMAAGFIVLTVSTAGGSNFFTPELRAIAKAANIGEKDLSLAARLSKNSVVKYGAELAGKTKGWLKDVRIGDPISHNQHLKEVRKYTEIAWDPTKPMIWGTTSTEKSFVRFLGADAREIGSWLTDAEHLIGKSPQEIEKTLALAATPTHVVKVTVPAGVSLSAGYVGKNAFGGGTGAVQYFLIEAETEYFGNAIKIGKTFGGSL